MRFFFHGLSASHIDPHISMARVGKKFRSHICDVGNKAILILPGAIFNGMLI